MATPDPIQQGIELFLEKNPFPKTLWIEATNICNLKCPMCPYLSMTRPKGQMALADFQKLLTECGRYPVKEINFQTFGEPLLHPQIFELIAFARRQSRAILIMHTNCTLIDAAMADRLLASDLDIIVLSLDSPDKETYEKLRDGASYETVMANVRQLLARKKERGGKGPRLFQQMIVMDETRDKVRKFYDDWKERLNAGDAINLKQYINFAGQVESREKPPEFSQLPCPLFFSSLMIAWDGTASPCCLDIDLKMNVGNALQTSISNVWHGAALNKLRRAVLVNDHDQLGFCQFCTGPGKVIETLLPPPAKQ